MSDLILAEAKEFNIEPSQAQELLANLPQIKSERDLLEAQFSEVIKMDIDLADTAKAARELRIMIQKNRTQGILLWHKNAKEFFLRGGQFVDAIKRKEVAINERMESDLELIEKHAEIKEAERKEKLRIERTEQCLEFMEFIPSSINLGFISDEEFAKVLNGARLQMNAKKEAEAKEEQERIAREEAERKSRENWERLLPYTQWIDGFNSLDFVSVDCDSIIKAASALKKAEEDEQERVKKENERLRKEAEERAKKEAEERAAAQAKIKAENEARIIAEQKLAAEVQRREAEERAKAAADLAAKKEAEKLAKAPIKKQMIAWVDGFSIATPPVTNAASAEIESKFQAFKTWAINQVNNI
jgi:hypothetical protein